MTHDIVHGYKLWIVIGLVLLASCARVAVAGQQYYVSPGGSDTNDGSLAAPFKTISKAAQVTSPGDTVFLRSGKFNERIAIDRSGSPGHYITYTAYPGEKPIIDGSGISVGSYPYYGIVNIWADYINISKLTVINSNYAGIYCRKNSAGVSPRFLVIANNSVNETRSSGIGIWNCTNVAVTGNRIVNAENNIVSAEECISLSSVTGFDVSYNEVSFTPGRAQGVGAMLTDVKEASRNGVVHDNYLHDAPDSGGIYIDAWDAGLNGKPSLSNVSVYNNYISNCGVGISLGAEYGGTNENIRVYNNVVIKSGSGILLHSTAYTPSQGNGLRRNIDISYNTVFETWQNGMAGIYITTDNIQNISIRNNIVAFYQVTTGTNYWVNQIGVCTPAALSQVSAKNNLIYGRQECSQDCPNCRIVANSTAITPSQVFVDPSANYNLHLKAGSAAIDAGSSIPWVTRDIDGLTRPQGNAPDIGAYEFSSSPTCVDADGDGYNAGGALCGTLDCNDNNAAVHPGASEICNGLDDNCNSQTDEWLGNLSCGIGACARSNAACANGHVQTCTAGSPTSETCNGLDDNCNSQTDEWLGNLSCGIGACARSNAACANGHAQSCTAGSPTSETCNGKDDDCDGITDDGLGNLTCGTGSCRRSIAACVGGVSQVCQPGASSLEICDGLDNDCDGSTDEGFNLGITCTAGNGTCARSGNMICAAGHQSAVCDALPGMPVTEICDGLDNNCDGRIDEGCDCIEGQVQSCGSDGGACKKGSQTCTNNAWGACAGAVNPVPEVCNGIDDDCDGMPDNGLVNITCGSGSCFRTRYPCSGGSQVACIPGTPAAELCGNSIDEDCDGKDTACPPPKADTGENRGVIHPPVEPNPPPAIRNDTTASGSTNGTTSGKKAGAIATGANSSGIPGAGGSARPGGELGGSANATNSSKSPASNQSLFMLGKNRMFGYGLIALIAILVISLAVIGAMPKKDARYAVELKRFVGKARSAGFSEGRIYHELMNSGWPKEIIDDAMKREKIR